MEDIIQKILEKLENAKSEIGRITITHEKDMQIIKNEMNVLRDNVEDFKASFKDLSSKVKEVDESIKAINFNCADRRYALESKLKEIENVQDKINSIFTILENTNVSIKRIIVAAIVALYFFIDGKNIGILKEVFSIILRIFGF